MRVLLVGADFEENLGVGMIAAAAEAAGHQVAIAPFNAPKAAAGIAARVAREAPDLVGLSIQFQHRSHEFVSLARALRRAGYRGHVTAGGQFPTLAAREVLGRGHGIDSVVLHDGEETIVELLAALEKGTPLDQVRGLAFVDQGGVRLTPGRGLGTSLDSLPFPKRYRRPSRHAGVPFVPIMGSRGCWGSCSYCSITSFYRDAKQAGGGPLLRLRSPDNVAEEMAGLSHAIGEACVFCFHDDNFLLPKPADSLERVQSIVGALRQRGVEKVGFIGKCRPETLSAELARQLAELGVVRLYVGVENVAEAGSDHLNRGVQHRAVSEALDACDAAGIFACYNLLVFEPKATLAHLRENVAFMRAHPAQPVNFCRAEPYYGTPLQLGLAASDKLGGSYLGWNYRIEDPRTELCFRIAAAAFRERNFRCDGVANRYMGVGYAAKLVEHFHPDVGGAHRRLRERAESLTRAITLDTARLLEKAVDLAEHADLADFDAIERKTALLALEVAAADRGWQHELDGFYAEVDAVVRRLGEPRAIRPKRPPARSGRNLALGASLALWALGCGGDTDDGPLPQDGGKDDHFVADPLPGDGGYDAGEDQMVADPLPEDAGVDADADDGDSMVADPPPADAGMSLNEPPAGRRELIDQWTDTGVRRAVRSKDLPLYDPPELELAATRVGGAIEVRILGLPEGASTRFEALGTVAADGPLARWTPADEAFDALSVAVRTRGGISVVSLRAKAVRTG